jgi:hypothetical protein
MPQPTRKWTENPMKRLFFVLPGCVILATSLSAGLITSAPAGGATTTFPGGSNCVFGPSSGTVAGFSLTASGNACYNYADGFALGSNGFWFLGLVGDNSGSTVITIDLGRLYSSVGGFMNYAPDWDTPVISALAADGTTVLESYNLVTSAPISTPWSDNAGAFRGISRTSADIRYFQVGGSYSVMHDITLSGGDATPEPTTVLLAGCALAALGLIRRVRR